MALRLAGEEWSVVAGLDHLGYPREIEANDADPGLRIDQSGSGPALRFQQAAIIDTATGDLTLDPASGIVLKQGGTEFASIAANTKDLGRVASNLWFRSIYLGTGIDFRGNNASVDAPDTDGQQALFKARDTGVGKVEVARLQGAADPYFQATLPMVLNPSSQPGTVVEGHFWYDSTAKKLKFYNGTGVETVTSA